MQLHGNKINIIKINVVAVLMLLSTLAEAQNLPSESPAATIIQRVGLSDVKITCSRPNVNGRQIFGTLVPFDQIWRTGADYPTRITLADTTFFQGGLHSLPPGEYALYTIPSRAKWTIIFSSNTRLWGAYGYSAKDDVLRFEVPVDTNAPFSESFTISFTHLFHDSAQIQLEWANTRVAFGISVDITQRVLNFIQTQIALEDTNNTNWRYYWIGAGFLLKENTRLHLALEWAEKSVDMHNYWFNCWTLAEVHAKLGQYDRAVEAGNKAVTNGTLPENAPYFPYQQVYLRQIETWKKKSRVTDTSR